MFPIVQMRARLDLIFSITNHLVFSLFNVYLKKLNKKDNFIKHFV